MKKLLVIFFLLLMTPSFALNVVVESLSDVKQDTANINFSAKVLENTQFDDGFAFCSNDIIRGKIIKSVEAKRAKRSGYIIIEIENIYREGVELPYSYENLEAKVVGYSKIDWKKAGAKTGLDAGLALGSHYLLPGLSQIFYFSKGIFMPYENKSRLESGIKSVYENSPFVYIEKGQEINIKSGDYLILKFYHTDVSKWNYFKRTN